MELRIAAVVTQKPVVLDWLLAATFVVAATCVPFAASDEETT